MIDLGCPTEIDGITIRNTNEGKTYRATADFTVYSSDNENGNWTYNLSDELFVTTDRYQTVTKRSFKLEPVFARYVKFQVDSYYGNGPGIQYLHLFKGINLIVHFYIGIIFLKQ